ncbi:MAG: PDZ domain-containing protein [Microthrixaceae bacterium]|nr:PDZ domain-containing protein [Microthrixaceae bacterium]
MTEHSVPINEPDLETEVDSPVDTDQPEPQPQSRARRRRLWWSAAGGLVVGAAIIAALFLIQLPYFVIQPGSVTPAEQRVEIEGARSFDTDGRVLFVTVFINRATPALMIRSWLDDSVEVRSKEEMYPEGDEDESRRENVVLMDTSKIVAEKVALTYLGLPAEFSGEGALVAGLVKSSPSKGVLEAGDVLVEVDDDPVKMPDDIGPALEDRRPGDTVGLVVERRSENAAASGSSAQAKPKRRRLELALGADPKDPDRPVLGIYVEPYALSVNSDIKVAVDSGDVTGPSAGLAWTLAIIDRLTPESLTDGKRVAVTGEIHADGSVGAVGGTPQKVAAVKRAGIKVFLYPKATPDADKRAIERIAGDDMKTYAVGTVDEAVKVLAPDGVHRP